MLVASSTCPEQLWVRIRKFETAEIQLSYDRINWWSSTIENLYDDDYDIILCKVGWEVDQAQYPIPMDEPQYSLDGKPIGVSTKAKEATPKYEPPLFEEREI